MIKVGKNRARILRSTQLNIKKNIKVNTTKISSKTDVNICEFRGGTIVWWLRTEDCGKTSC